MKKNKVLKIVIGLVILAAVIAILVYARYQLFINPYRGTVESRANAGPLESELTEKQVLKDMDYAIDKLRGRHPAWLEDGNQRVSDVEAAYETERQQVLTDDKDSYTVLEEWKMLGRVLHPLYDGHTRVAYFSDTDGYINDSTQLNELGLPDQINGTPTEEVLEEYLKVFQYEREEYARACFDKVLQKESQLRLCGVDTSDGVTYTFQTEDGPKDYHYTFAPENQSAGQQGEEGEWVSYSFDESTSTAVFTLKECNYDDFYEDTLKGFFDQVQEKNIENIIVDLRGNPGGNSYVADSFLMYLDIDGFDSWSSDVRYGNRLHHNEPYHVTVEKKENPFSGNLYVLTDVYTYSAAMDFTMLVADNHLGTIVGEASGNLPDSYGDILMFALPNSKLTLTVSYKNWHRIDQSKTGEPIEPDYPCDPKDAMGVAQRLIRENK
ncbi:MAG: S41 family peptidase [Lachnospiraceae bacterium]|nr:S41 family peptidase [Lachnospiraceae bacterium]